MIKIAKKITTRELVFPIYWTVKLYLFRGFKTKKGTYNIITEVKASEQKFPVVMFIMLYKVVLTFESVDEILKCDHSNESY